MAPGEYAPAGIPAARPDRPGRPGGRRAGGPGPRGGGRRRGRGDAGGRTYPAQRVALLRPLAAGPGPARIMIASESRPGRSPAPQGPARQNGPGSGRRPRWAGSRRRQNAQVNR